MKQFLGIMILVFFNGCSTQLEVRELPLTMEANKVVKGVPFRLKEPFELELFQLQNDEYKSIHKQNSVLPNPHKLYLLGFSGGPFSDSSINLTLNKDNTISTVDLTSSSSADETISALSESLSAVTTAESARRQAEEAVEEGKETALVASEDAEIAALSALQEVELAETKLLALPAKPTAEELLAAQHAVELAKLKANIAARRAGLKLPYPDF